MDEKKHQAAYTSGLMLEEMTQEGGLPGSDGA